MLYLKSHITKKSQNANKHYEWNVNCALCLIWTVKQTLPNSGKTVFILAQTNGVKNQCSRKQKKKECDKDTDGTETGLLKQT